jgi:hypothetical protein
VISQKTDGIAYHLSGRAADLPLENKNMSLLLIIIILILLFGGGGGYYAHSQYGGRGLGGVLGLIVVILVVLWLFGALGGGGIYR